MTKGYNALDVLSRVSGRPRKEVDGIWESVKKNHAKLDSCSLHRFGKIRYKLGGSHKCLNCGGEMRNGDIHMYAKGYAAAGGNKKDIYEYLVGKHPSGKEGG